MPDLLGGCGGEFKAYYENDSLKYCPNNNCDLIVNTKTNKKNQSKVSIFPNPTSGKINISSKL